MKEWIVSKAEAGGRLDKYIKARLNTAPDSFIYKMARKKNLLLNEKKCTGKEILHDGDHIKLYVSDDTINLFSSPDQSFRDSDCYKTAYKELKGIRVIKEEQDVIFLFKPAGILSQKATPSDLSLNEWFIGYLLNTNRITEKSLSVFKPSVLNRLDRNTSGIVICGITPAGSRYLSSLIKNHSIRKFYQCLVYGNCTLNGEFDGFLYKDERKNHVSFYKRKEDIPKEQINAAKPVSLSVNVLQTKKDISLLEINLHTGKSHQIRAMLSGFGYPIIGDLKYGTESSQKFKHKEGQLLCAVRVEFPEITGDFSYLNNQIISCQAPFADEWIDNQK